MRLLGEGRDVRARSVDERTVELLGPVPKVAEPLLLRTLALADDSGPLYVRGRTGEGLAVLAAWSAAPRHRAIGAGRIVGEALATR